MDSITEMQEWCAARFELAVLPYLDHIYSAALLMTRDLDDADELVQGTFAQAYASLNEVQRDADIKAWLYHALSSTLTEISEWRQPEPQPMAAENPRHLQLADAEPPIPSGIGRRMDSEALNQLPDSEIKKALQELPADLRLTVYLADVEGYTYAEIADIVEAPIPAVASRLHQGRRRLRGLLLSHANTAAVVRLQRR
jgi:RNA polymerase sigma-70 factor (ECF subfamily)